MSSRVVKKIIYAVGAVGVIGLLGFIAAGLSGTQAPPTPLPSPTVSFRPIEVEDVVVLSQAQDSSASFRSYDLVATLKNPNLRAGVDSYNLQFTLYDAAGSVIATPEVSTYLLPGARQYAAAVDVRVPANRRVGRVETTKPQDVQFIELPDSVDLPQFNVFLRERRSKAVGGQTVEEQAGLVTNASTFDWERVEVAGVGLNAAGRIVAVGKTFVGRLEVGEQREFTLQWPQSADPVTQVLALPSTNIFREENIVDVIGDPGTLR